MRPRCTRALVTHVCTAPRRHVLRHRTYLWLIDNPLSLFCCHDRDGELRCVVAEVHNTYGGRHCCLLGIPLSRTSSGTTSLDARSAARSGGRSCTRRSDVNNTIETLTKPLQDAPGRDSLRLCTSLPPARCYGPRPRTLRRGTAELLDAESVAAATLRSEIVTLCNQRR